MEFDRFTVETAIYNKEFWNEMMRGIKRNNNSLDKGNIGNGMFVLPYDSNKKFNEHLKENSIIRKIATNIKSKDSDLDIWVSDSDDVADWQSTGDPQEIKNVVKNFNRKKIEAHKLSIISRIDTDIIQDEKFDLEDYLIKQFSKSFAKTEDNAFINGTGINMPTGILHDTEGAEVGVTTNELTFDNVINLYFSSKPEYRTNGSWIMNDEIAKKLYTLKDNDGNYLWNHNSNTIMGRPVFIANDMPSTNKVIAFGDFSYYWIINRMPLSTRALNELFDAYQQVGYLAHEYLDAKLIRAESVKVLVLES